MTFKEYWKGLYPDKKHALADRLGVTYTYLSMIANGKRNAGIKIMLNISKVTGGKVSMKSLRPDLYE